MPPLAMNRWKDAAEQPGLRLLSGKVTSLAGALSGLIGLSLVGLSCQSGGGEFVGDEGHPKRGVDCFQCELDIVPQLVNCEAAEEGVEFLPMPLWNFEDGVASHMYTYYDGSSAGWNLEPEQTWQPDTEAVPRCAGQEATRAFHMRAGPFENWGGGVGRHFKCLNGINTPTGVDKLGSGAAIARACDADEPVRACEGIDNDPEVLDYDTELVRSACPEIDRRVIAAGDDLAAIPASQEFMLGMTLDFTQWDGISFWARGSSDAQRGLRIMIGDKYTDDDLSFMQYHVNPYDQRFCERNVECGCPGNTRCYPPRDPGDIVAGRCYDSPIRLGRYVVDEFGNITAAGTQPAAPPAEGGQPPGNGADDNAFDIYQECGVSICEEVASGVLTPRYYDSAQHPDQMRAGTTCEPYAFRGGIEEPYCMNSAIGQSPYESNLLCGDHWMSTVTLSNEWQFFKVPFDTLLQQGWAQESFKLDLANVGMMRLSWGTGWVDFWIDDIRVYRDKHNTSKN